MLTYHLKKKGSSYIEQCIHCCKHVMSQLQVASYLARAPAAHMPERGVTWHTPTPPPHLYHDPTTPDPLQVSLTSTANGHINVYSFITIISGLVNLRVMMLFHC